MPWLKTGVTHYHAQLKHLLNLGVSSEWELGSLLLEGHCFEAGTGNPTRGLQLNLGTRGKPNLTDTIVMANLGYFQLKVSDVIFWK